MSDWQEEGQGGGATEEGGSEGATQEAIDEESPSQPADVGGWTETEDTPHQGEEGQA